MADSKNSQIATEKGVIKISKEEFETAALTNLFHSNDVERIDGPDGIDVASSSDSIIITGQVFDFTHVGQYAEKTLRGFVAPHAFITFQKCIFIGALSMVKCAFKQVVFEDCHFVKPQKAPWLGDMKILSFAGGGDIEISRTMFATDISIDGIAGKIVLDTVYAPHVFLSGLKQTVSKELKVERFSGTTIYMPEEGFYKVTTDDMSAPAFHGLCQDLSLYIIKRAR